MNVVKHEKDGPARELGQFADDDDQVKPMKLPLNEQTLEDEMKVSPLTRVMSLESQKASKNEIIKL